MGDIIYIKKLVLMINPPCSFVSVDLSAFYRLSVNHLTSSRLFEADMG